jgi:repressor LexA
MLTQRQKEALDFIDSYITAAGGVSPTFSEIRDAIGLSNKSGAHRIVASLVERGLIRRKRGRSRAIEVIRRPLRAKYFKFDDETKQLKEIKT